MEGPYDTDDVPVSPQVIFNDVINIHIANNFTPQTIPFPIVMVDKFVKVGHKAKIVRGYYVIYKRNIFPTEKLDSNSVTGNYLYLLTSCYQ